MTQKENGFNIGTYRPIYLWGGPGTIRMNRIKFMNQPVDEAAHHEVHTQTGAQRVVNSMYCNWVHLMYNWGFPPEVEQEDWRDFERAAEIYHQLGSKVFAYVQTSNCVYDGSFRDKNWYARDPHGKKVFYYSGRYMTCLNQPDWVEHLKGIIAGAIQRGADGIFFDNLWDGCMPVSLFNAWLGAAGCHCERCKESYRKAKGSGIPIQIDPEKPEIKRYLRWRADRLTELMTDLSNYVEELKPGAPVSANDYDVVMRDTYLVYGQDTRALARIKPITMIENFALPRWDAEPKPRLANNALTVRNARALIRKTAHLSVLSYDVGIGFDGVYPARRYQQGIGEAAACGASMTIKGTEYFHAGQHTVLVTEQFSTVHEAIGKYHRWLEANAGLFKDRENCAVIGLLHPGERLWLDWLHMAPVYLGAGQVLLAEGYPWKVVMPGGDLSGLEVLLVFDPTILEKIDIPAGLRVVLVPLLDGWRKTGRSMVERYQIIRDVVSKGAHSLMDAYFSKRIARQVIEGIGLHRLITQTALFYLPDTIAKISLLDALGLKRLLPRVKAEQPVLIEIWRKEGEFQIHLLNYASSPQTARVLFDSPIIAREISPDFDEKRFVSGKAVDVKLDVYTVLIATE
jgi:hypothetical protein